MIETHAHIYDPQYDEDRDAMLNRAWESGIQQIWMPNCDTTTLESMLQLSRQYPDKCLPMIGLHPCYVKEDFEKELAILEAAIKANPNCIAIGEIGMDLYWDKTFQSQQEEAFLIQCQWAIDNHLWIDIHSRNAFKETVALIEKFANPNLTGIFHCFSGDINDAKKAIELGFKLGIGGVVTFKNGGLDKLLKEIDLTHIVLETDCPYLAPVPHRGKRNEVVFIEYVAQKIADIYEKPVSYIIEVTTQNALHLVR